MTQAQPTRMSLTSPDTPLYAYLLAHQPAERNELRDLREVTHGMWNHFMQIGPEQGHFMAFLIKLTGAQKVLELGTFTGYSALAMALALPEHGKLISCDISEEWIGIGRPFWAKAGVASKIEVRLGPALETMSCMEKDGQQDSFDVVFIDADKENYGRYYEAALRLVRVGGLIIVDNTLRLGRVVDAEAREEGTVVMRELNTRIVGDERVDRVMLPIGDGVTLVRRR